MSHRPLAILLMAGAFACDASAPGDDADAGADVDAGVPAELTRIDLGLVATSELQRWDVPPNTLGLTVVARMAGGGRPGVYFLRPRAPAGESIRHIVSFCGFYQPGVMSPEERYVGDQIVAAQVPQSDHAAAWPITPGEWNTMIRDRADAGDRADLTVWLRTTEDGLFHGGAIDFHVYRSPGAVPMAEIRARLADIFPYAGLELGTITEHALDASADVVDTAAEHEALLAQTVASGDAPAVNLLVVTDFGGGFPSGLAGLVLGVPATPTLHGTRTSGLVWAPVGDPEDDARILAHELGHVAGLFHTSSFGGAEPDHLADTPYCEPAIILLAGVRYDPELVAIFRGLDHARWRAIADDVEAARQAGATVAA